MILFAIPLFLHELPWHLFYLALGVTGLACFRLSKRGADQVFILAAWLAIIHVAVIGTAWILGWSTSFIPGWRMWVAQSYTHFLTASYIAYFGHLVAFAVAAFRTAARLPARPASD